jgi:hypothetical protein
MAGSQRRVPAVALTRGRKTLTTPDFSGDLHRTGRTAATADARGGLHGMIMPAGWDGVQTLRDPHPPSRACHSPAEARLIVQNIGKPCRTEAGDEAIDGDLHLVAVADRWAQSDQDCAVPDMRAAAFALNHRSRSRCAESLPTRSAATRPKPSDMEASTASPRSPRSHCMSLPPSWGSPSLPSWLTPWRWGRVKAHQCPGTSMPLSAVGRNDR